MAAQPLFYPLADGLRDPTVVEILEHHRNEAQRREESVLVSRAALSRDHDRYFGREDDHRLPYKRDVDRIVHSKAYTRYIDKTQVLYLFDNDHITHRVLHVQLVSNFARGIAEILRLNLDLVEAIALGHDVGHPPFGHEGENYLSELSVEYCGQTFAHTYQSCRLFREIEPLNLGLNVYDGFLCHDGGLRQTRFVPKFGKSWDDHFAELEVKLGDPDGNLWPATLEGCLVKLCDTVSYLGRDIEDAIRVGLLARDQVPKTVLGQTNREILSRVASDVIASSYGRDEIAMSEETFEGLRLLRQCNFDHIYLHPKIKVESERVRRSYRLLFQILLDDYDEKGVESRLWRHFLANKPEGYLEMYEPPTYVVDYISGMTDRYFVATLQSLAIPKRITLE